MTTRVRAVRAKPRPARPTPRPEPAAPKAPADRHPRIHHWDDERGIGNSLIVTLKRGWRFAGPAFSPEHVQGFDTVNGALQGARKAQPCACAECAKKDEAGD